MVDFKADWKVASRKQRVWFVVEVLLSIVIGLPGVVSAVYALILVVTTDKHAPFPWFYFSCALLSACLLVLLMDIDEKHK